MARTLQDREIAIAGAKDLFWRAGYEETSIEDVVAATGYNRYALYNEFGGKRDLFLAVLSAYHNERKTIFLGALADMDAPPLDAIRKVMAFAIREMTARQTGCLICNIGSEVARTDDIVAARVKAHVDEIRGAFTKAMMRAAERGELHTGLDPAGGADLMTTIMMGLCLRADQGAGEEELMCLLETAMTSLSATEDVSAPQTQSIRH